jgi:Divergent InlB B-repeat domain
MRPAENRRPSMGLAAAIAISALLLLSGCFWDDGSAEGGDAEGPVLAIEGVFQGGGVSGVAYQTPTLSGTTSELGTFRYQAAEEVTFTIGGVVLGRALGGARLTLVDLVPGAVDESDPVVTNLGRLLFALDSDCNPSNGISVSPAIRDALTGRTVDFKLSDEDFESSLAPFFDTARTLHLFACGDVSLASVDEARRRLRAVLRGVPQYRLAVKAGQHSSVVVDPAREFYDEGETVSLSLVPDPGWKFRTWLGDVAPYQNPATVVMNADRTVVALAETVVPEIFQVPVVLRITPTGSGTVSADPAGGAYHADPHGYLGKNVVVSVTARPDPGWTFDHWEGDLAGSDNPETIVIDAYKFVTAVFVPVAASRRTLTVDTDGMGVVRLDPPGGVYYAGTQVRVTALPDSEWMFAQWGGDLAGSEPSVPLVMDSNRSIAAQFIEVPGVRFTLTAETDRGTVVGFWPPATLSHAGSTVSARYSPGTIVTVTASTRPGYTFVSWGGDLSGSLNPQFITMDGDKRISLVSVEAP